MSTVHVKIWRKVIMVRMLERGYVYILEHTSMALNKLQSNQFIMYSTPIRIEHAHVHNASITLGSAASKR
jgi:hypothetical protein